MAYTIRQYQTKSGKRYEVRYRKPDGAPTGKRGFRRKMEPHASSPQKKLAALAALKEAGIGTSVMAAPIFPGITDCAALIESAAPHVSEMNFDTLNLRNQNRESILAIVNTLRPELTGLYNEIYRQGRKDYWQTLRGEIKDNCRRFAVRASVFF